MRHFERWPQDCPMQQVLCVQQLSHAAVGASDDQLAGDDVRPFEMAPFCERVARRTQHDQGVAKQQPLQKIIGVASHRHQCDVSRP